VSLATSDAQKTLPEPQSLLAVDPNVPDAAHFNPDDVGDHLLDHSTSPSGRQMVADRERAAHLTVVRGHLRQTVNDRLRPAISGISAAELNEASEATREKVAGIVRDTIAEMERRGLSGHGPVITRESAEHLFGFMMDLLFGAGELEYLFKEPDVEDIVINTVRGRDGEPTVDVWTYRQTGKRREAVSVSAADVLEMVNRNAARQGRKLDPMMPMLDAQMRNGSRVNAVLNPIADPFLAVTIRIHRLIARRVEDLVKLGTLTPAAATWLDMCIKARLAIVVGGGTSSGKTNLLNALARMIDPRERIVVIEDTRELDLAVDDKVYLSTARSNDPSRAVTQRHLVANALRMRPDRLVLGEVRTGAAWDAIKAATTGHDGTLLTVHAEDASGVINRLVRLSREAEETAHMPDQTMKEAVATAFQLVVFLQRVTNPDGSYSRRVTEIVEFNGFVTDSMVNQRRLFAWQNGRLEWTRQLPHERILRRFHDAGYTTHDIEAALSQ